MDLTVGIASSLTSYIVKLAFYKSLSSTNQKAASKFLFFFLNKQLLKLIRLTRGDWKN